MPRLPSDSGTACARAYLVVCRKQLMQRLHMSAVSAKHSLYALRADVDGDGISLVSPRRFMTRYSPPLDVRI
jgi:hypothetical protein